MYRFIVPTLKKGLEYYVLRGHIIFFNFLKKSGVFSKTTDNLIFRFIFYEKSGFDLNTSLDKRKSIHDLLVYFLKF